MLLSKQSNQRLCGLPIQLVAAIDSKALDAKHMLHVYTLPHVVRLCSGGLGLLRSVLRSRCNPATYTSLRFVSKANVDKLT